MSLKALPESERRVDRQQPQGLVRDGHRRKALSVLVRWKQYDNLYRPIVVGDDDLLAG